MPAKSWILRHYNHHKWSLQEILGQRNFQEIVIVTPHGARTFRSSFSSTTPRHAIHLDPLTTKLCSLLLLKFLPVFNARHQILRLKMWKPHTKRVLVKKKKRNKKFFTRIIKCRYLQYELLKHFY
jgi:hypothetical protein